MTYFTRAKGVVRTRVFVRMCYLVVHKRQTFVKCRHIHLHLISIYLFLFRVFSFSFLILIQLLVPYGSVLVHISLRLVVTLIWTVAVKFSGYSFAYSSHLHSCLMLFPSHLSFDYPNITSLPWVQIFSTVLCHQTSAVYAKYDA